jgi:hypothetical protein
LVQSESGSDGKLLLIDGNLPANDLEVVVTRIKPPANRGQSVHLLQLIRKFFDAIDSPATSKWWPWSTSRASSFHCSVVYRIKVAPF